MGKNRDRLSLVAAILEAAGAGTSKTRIMFAANMSFKLLEKYLDASLHLGFVQSNGSSYVLTLRGRDFLNRYKRFEERYSKAQDMLSDLSGERELLERLCQKNAKGIEVKSLSVGKA